MTKPLQSQQDHPTTALDRALDRILAEVYEGLRHGHFEYVVTCEVIGQERRRLVLRAGKSHQFLITKEDCERRPVPESDSRHGGDTDTT